MKLSIGSLQLLDTQACNMLGSFFFKSKIKVIMSQQVDHSAILGMFKYLDSDNNGYLDLNEFSVAFDAFRHQNMAQQSLLWQENDNNDKMNKYDIYMKNKLNEKENELKIAVFQRLAIRRLKKRDRMYVCVFICT